jgi:hypothetical protein
MDIDEVTRRYLLCDVGEGKDAEQELGQPSRYCWIIYLELRCI